MLLPSSPMETDEGEASRPLPQNEPDNGDVEKPSQRQGKIIEPSSSNDSSKSQSSQVMVIDTAGETSVASVAVDKVESSSSPVSPSTPSPPALAAATEADNTTAPARSPSSPTASSSTSTARISRRSRRGGDQSSQRQGRLEKLQEIQRHSSVAEETKHYNSQKTTTSTSTTATTEITSTAATEFQVVTSSPIDASTTDDTGTRADTPPLSAPRTRPSGRIPRRNRHASGAASSRQNSAAEKLKEIRQSQQRPVATITQPTQVPQKVVDNPVSMQESHDDDEDENDVFAASILQQRSLQPSSVTTSMASSAASNTAGLSSSSLSGSNLDSKLGQAFDITVSPNTTAPDEYIDIFIQGPSDLDGLLTIVLMALNVEKWLVADVAKTTSESPENAHGEEETAELQEQRIVVKIPDATTSASNATRLQEELRLLLSSSCQDYVSPQRSLQPLVDAFGRTIQPQGQQLSAQPNRPSRTSSKMASLSSATNEPNNASNNDSGAPSFHHDEPPTNPNGTVPYSSSLENPDPQRQPLAISRLSYGIDVVNEEETTELGPSAQQPGAVSARGRAFGAPLRPTPRRSLASFAGVSSRSRGGWQSTRQWISNRLLFGGAGNSSRRGGVGSENAVPVAAEVVDESAHTEELEATIRQQIMREATTASVISIGDEHLNSSEREKELRQQQRQVLMLSCLAILLLVGAVIGLAAGLTRENRLDTTPSPTLSFAPSTSPTMTPLPALTGITERGKLRCSVGEGGALERLETDLCRALAAAILGASNQIELVPSTRTNRFQLLHERHTDILIRLTTHTTGRSVQEPTTGQGFSFSSPYFYDGLVFAGLEEVFVNCANRLDSFFGACRGLIICVLVGTTHYEFLNGRVPQQNLRAVETFDNVLANNQCNVIGQESAQIYQWFLIATMGEDAAANDGDAIITARTDNNFLLGSNVFTKEPLAMVTRSDDYEWTLFVETVLQGLLEAEGQNITQATHEKFPSVPYYSEYPEIVVDALAGIGNFGEVYDRNVDENLEREGLNRLRIGDCEEEGGLLYSFPFGNVPDLDPRKGENGTLEDIVKRRGQFRCGVATGGKEDGIFLFNLELCKATSVALFGSVDRFQTVNFTAIDVVALDLLQEVDVLIGVAASVLPVLGSRLQNYFFSNPYFFPEQKEGLEEEKQLMTRMGLVVMTKSGDHQWSMFVQWILDAVITADEKFISKESGDFLPEVSLVGASYDDMFRDIITSVGNYGEIYERAFKAPRYGCNQPNLSPHGPQHSPFLFHGF